MPVHTGKGSRSYGTVLIDRGNPEARGTSKPTTRKFNVEVYNLTGELIYLDEVEGIKVSAETEKRMKAEIKTVEDFNKAGGIRGVVKTYRCNIKRVSDYYKELASKGQNQAPSEPEGASEGGCTREPVSVACTSNLSEKELALEMVAAVTAKVTTQIKAKLEQNIADYFKDAWGVLEQADSSRKVDVLYTEIQRELLTDVEAGILERLGEGE